MIPDKWTALSSSCGPTSGPLAKGAPRASPGQPCPHQGEGSLSLCIDSWEVSHPKAPVGWGVNPSFVLR